MEQENKYEIVKDVNLEIGQMKWNETKERLELQTNKGQITIKGKKSVTESVRGLPVIKSASFTLDDLPQKVFDFIRVINEKGYIIVKASYTCMTTIVDGEEKQYRFLDFKQFENWEQESTPSGASSLPKVTDCILPRNDIERRANDYLYAREALKDKLSLNMISKEEYDSELLKIKAKLKKGLNASE